LISKFYWIGKAIKYLDQSKAFRRTKKGGWQNCTILEEKVSIGSGNTLLGGMRPTKRGISLNEPRLKLPNHKKEGSPNQFFPF